MVRTGESRRHPRRARPR